MSTHEKWMKLAMNEAEKGRLNVSPNPMVGACVVSGDKLIAKGAHERYGGAHAEVNALNRAGKRACGAVLYVTLEPCSTWGKTPPCAAAVIDAGIRHVVIGTLDPNPKNHRGGVTALRRAGIRVTTGILRTDCVRQNEAFFKRMRTGLPFVTLKMAQSMDGKIANSRGDSKWISSLRARRFVHKLRAEQDALLIGKNTLLKDDPRLTARVRTAKRRSDRPWRVILDPKMELGPQARVLKGRQLTIQAVSEKALRASVRKGRRQRFDGRVLCPIREKRGHMDLSELLKELASLGANRVMVEGGGELAWSLLNEGLVDRAFWVIAPKVIGGRLSKTSVEGAGVSDVKDAIQFKHVQCSLLGPDWLFKAEF